MLFESLETLPLKVPLVAMNFTVSWTITQANMEVDIMHAESFASYPYFCE